MDDDDLATRRFDLAVLRSLMEFFVKAFNDGDLDELLAIVLPTAELPGLGERHEFLARELTALWDRDPSVTATAGWHGANPVVVLWSRGQDDWVRSGAVAIDGNLDGITRAQLLVPPDDVSLARSLISEAEPRPDRVVLATDTAPPSRQTEVEHRR